MTLTKSDKAEINKMIQEALMESQDTAVELPSERLLSDWEPGETLKVMVDGEEHEIALKPYYEYDEDGIKKTEFTWDEAMKIPTHPDGWRIPTRHEFVEIIEQLGQDKNGDISRKLGEITDWAGRFWSTTKYDSSSAWALYVSSSRAYVRSYVKFYSRRIVCYR